MSPDRAAGAGFRSRVHWFRAPGRAPRQAVRRRSGASRERVDARCAPRLQGAAWCEGSGSVFRTMPPRRPPRTWSVGADTDGAVRGRSGSRMEQYRRRPEAAVRAVRSPPCSPRPVVPSPSYEACRQNPCRPNHAVPSRSAKVEGASPPPVAPAQPPDTVQSGSAVQPAHRDVSIGARLRAPHDLPHRSPQDPHPSNRTVC